MFSRRFCSDIFSFSPDLLFHCSPTLIFGLDGQKIGMTRRLLNFLCTVSATGKPDCVSGWTREHPEEWIWC